MVADGMLRVTRSVSVPLAEITIRVSRSSGPGGQHANTASTRVEAVLDLETTSALTERQRARAIARAGPVVRAVAQDERSQARNRELALERLTTKLREALRVERRRVATAPTAASRERRLIWSAVCQGSARGRRSLIGCFGPVGEAPGAWTTVGLSV